MKNLLFALLFVPIMSFGQEITFDELMSINSLDTFKRVVIENSFEFSNGDNFITYGYKLDTNKKGEEVATKWASYAKETGAFIFQFLKDGLWVDREYNRIVSDIKAKCEYFEINDEYVTYNCDDSTFEGQIGFMTSGGSGYVGMIPTIDFASLEKD